VGVLGQRQVGKTTLTESNSKEYATLDLRSTMNAAEDTPQLFLEKRQNPFTIDECQLAVP
jgi:predicted AAA+ superfamily ATPase